MSTVRNIVATSALLCACIWLAPASHAQTDTATVDEDVVIAIGRKSPSGLKAMQAFNIGDYATAEIEFDRHFDAIRRMDRNMQRAARTGADAQLSGLIAQGPGDLSATGGGNSGPAVATTDSASLNASSDNAAQAGALRNASGRDTEVGYEDFAFARYMKGLSQIQLGKYAEAKASLRESVKHNYRNYDAQMRLGLLELRDAEVLEARERLIRLDKMRQACGTCDDKAEISNATVTLAKALTAATAN